MNIDLTLAALEWHKVGITVLVTIGIAIVILTFLEMEPSKDKAPDQPNEPKREEHPGALQTGLGVLIALASVAVGAYIYLFYDVTVDTAFGGSVVNIHKNSDKMILLGGCGVGVIVGTLMGVVGTMRQGAGMGRQSDNQTGGQ